VNSLELHMSQSCPQQHGHRRGLVLHVVFKGCHTRAYLMWRRWNEARVAWTSAADPILSTSKLTGVLITAAPLSHEYLVHFAQ
jgi:hypothetical protein